MRKIHFDDGLLPDPLEELQLTTLPQTSSYTVTLWETVWVGNDTMRQKGERGR